MEQQKESIYPPFGNITIKKVLLWFVYAIIGNFTIKQTRFLGFTKTSKGNLPPFPAVHTISVLHALSLICLQP